MAGWVTHTIIADLLMAEGLVVDPKGFVVGNIAPDCNVENHDWTAFEPSREIMHWMSEYGNKLTADFQGFYDRWILDKTLSYEAYSFMLGYYAHLIADVAFQKYVREPSRIQDLFKRLKGHTKYRKEITDVDENFDVIKQAYGKDRVFRDIDHYEQIYLTTNEAASYLRVLQHVEDFPDYLSYLPQGAISRKIKLLVSSGDLEDVHEERVFFPKEEYDIFIEDTVAEIMACISERINNKRS